MPGAFEIRIAASAMTSIQRASRWWRKNRRAAPQLFDRELNAALDLLEVHPWVGTRAMHPVHGEVRVVVLQRSRYRVAYQLHEAAEQVWIVQVRHTSRHPTRGR
ncbi:MAG: type II toxin-antitoxin system RelE/ParE family toxin [Deltaproteobacteria bacterium]|nr:type II toxin-antitoxin system RelE/ParE family toxin [Kofleriaceae bacterium]